jgi:hypothetical protein
MNNNNNICNLKFTLQAYKYHCDDDDDDDGDDDMCNKTLLNCRNQIFLTNT